MNAIEGIVSVVAVVSICAIGMLSAVYTNEPAPLPLNAGMPVTNSMVFTNKITVLEPPKLPEWPKTLVVFEPSPIPANTFSLGGGNGIVGTNYPFGYMDGTNRVEIGSFIKLTRE